MWSRPSSRLRAKGLQVTLDHLGEDTTDRATADATVAAYLELIEALSAAGQVAGAEVSVKLSAVGQALTAAARPPRLAATPTRLAGASKIADAAYAAGARVNLDIEDHTTIDQTLEVLFELRRTHPDVGVAIQAMLLRTPKDLAELTGPGSRVRLVKGAYNEPASVAYTDPDQIDLAYVRAMKYLMYGKGYPMIGSHDPRMVAIAAKLAADAGRTPDRWEHQMLFGIRPDEQERLVKERQDDAGVRAVRGRLVRLFHPPARRTPRQPAVLPALAGQQGLTRTSSLRIAGTDASPRAAPQRTGTEGSTWTPSPTRRCRSTNRCWTTHPARPSGPRWSTALDAVTEPVELGAVIGGVSRRPSGAAFEVVAPFDHRRILATSANSTQADAAEAVQAALDAAAGWRALDFDSRAAILLRAADLLAGPWRARINAATMLGQAKTAYQAEIDSACELADFWRFNVHFARQILAEQPMANAKGIWNRTDHRPLEGFVYAVTPFNFTAIAGNLPTAPALMGNVVVWKPSITQQLAASLIMDLLHEAGLPPGVINMLPGARPGDLRGGARPPGAGRHPFHRLHQGFPAVVGAGRGEHRRLQVLPAAGRRDRRQGFRASRTRPPTSMCCAPRWSAARSSTRDRSARPRPGPTSRRRSGRR